MTLAQHGYNLQFRILGAEDGNWQEVIAEHAMERGTDGILLLLQDRDEFSSLGRLDHLELDVPVITINRGLFPNIGSVQVDNRQGARDVVDYLISLGHKRIAHISGPSDSFDAEDRQAGYLESMALAGLDVPEGYLLEGDWQMQSGHDLLRKLMALPIRPTAVFCSNDHMAVGALEASRDMGIAVPKDVSLVGFDDSEIASVVAPRLTTVKQPLEEVGNAAAKQILGRKSYKPYMVKHTVIMPSLVKRESCARLLI